MGGRDGRHKGLNIAALTPITGSSSLNLAASGAKSGEIFTTARILEPTHPANGHK
jgi:hypothetical protein